MKYLVIGAGGTGGSIAGFMAAAGRDVTVIARGAHLEAIKTKGLTMDAGIREKFTTALKAETMESYKESPDVILVCLKAYSLDDCIGFIDRVAHKDTIVIPILNVFGTGSKMQKRLPNISVTDGVIYVAAQIAEQGTIKLFGNMLEVIFGPRTSEEYKPVMDEIAADMTACGVTTACVPDIQEKAFLKFSMISPMSAIGVYYNSPVDLVHEEGEARETLKSLLSEMGELGKAMGLKYEKSIAEVNLAKIDSFAPGTTSSVQRDYWAGKQSELDAIIFEVTRLGEQFGVNMPVYNEICKKIKKTV